MEAVSYTHLDVYKRQAIINLRDYYPFYTSDCFMEVSEEVAEMFKEFDRKEA